MTDIDHRAITDTVCIVVYTIDTRLYGLFLNDVERLERAVKITPLPGAPETILGLVNVHGRFMPVVSTRRALNLPGREVAPSDQFIIARIAKRMVILAVDSVKGVVERPKAEITARDEVIPGLENLRGVIKLDDNLILIHDLGRFLSSVEKEWIDEALENI